MNTNSEHIYTPIPLERKKQMSDTQAGKQEGEKMAKQIPRLHKKQKWGYTLASAVPIGNIKLDESNVRMGKFDPERNVEDAQLVKSVKQLGLLHPPLAYERERGIYFIIDGGRRFEAAKKAGRKDIPLIVRPLEQEGTMAIRTTASAIGTLQHRPLNYLEKAYVARDLLKTFKSETAVGRQLNMSVKTINEWLAFLKAPPIVRDMVVKGEMDGKTAVANFVRLNITTDDQAKEILSKIKGKSQAKAREIIKKIKRVGATISIELYNKFKAKAGKKKISEALKEAIEAYVK